MRSKVFEFKQKIERETVEVSVTSSSGFSLVEVLVAILVLAVGVIGAVGMQLSALRSTQQSAMQTIATQLASDVVERMRANPDVMREEDARNPYLSVDFDTRSESVSNDRQPSCQQGKCDPSQIAQVDIRDWLTQLNDRLPGARAQICRDAAPWDDATGAMRWSCRIDPAAPVVIKLGWHVKDGLNEEAPQLTLQTVF